ncbi:glucosyltransferase domain-containing protein [Bifidobacterium longum]|uniref:glucosyltransferase domain-containing protein n=1 Tax=Bifidobacterium longum TaxID=216816 RepID=UPI001106A085|nr:glucosyltransferase domain-containing protein [Bifidobacterium longum]MDB6895480.1 glucosyltransferase domain-containing protein [Bifidobacterium longum]
MTASISMDTTTTTQSISQNDNSSLTSYSLQGFLQFVMHNSKQIIISMLFLLLAFGQKLFSNTFSIDTQGIIQNNDALYKSWFELERFGLVLFKKLTGTYLYNNALASFTMVVFFGISAMVWAYLLCSASHTMKLQPAFFIIPYVASPIFAEMLGFLLLGPEISIAAILTAISLMMWANAAASSSAKQRILLVIASIVCATLSFTMYLAMVTFFITGTAILYVLKYSDSKYQNHDKNESRAFLIGSVVIFVVSYALYKLLNALAMKVKGVTTNAYISDQSRWGKDSPSVILHNMGSHILALYSGEGIFYSVIFSICALCVFVAAIYHVITKKISLFSCLVVLLIVLSPTIMSFVLGGIPSVRTEMTYPLAFSFITMVLFSGIVFTIQRNAQSIRAEAVTIVAWILIIAIGWNQALITSRIFYTENIVFTQDVLTAQEIKSRIDELGLGEHPNEPLVFVGNHVAKCSPDCYSADQLGLTGRSMLEIGFSTEHGTGVKKQFMVDVLGVYYNSATSEQIEQSEELAESMPHWPDPGSVAEKDGIIIVNF